MLFSRLKVPCGQHACCCIGARQSCSRGASPCRRGCFKSIISTRSKRNTSFDGLLLLLLLWLYPWLLTLLHLSSSMCFTAGFPFHRSSSETLTLGLAFL